MGESTELPSTAAGDCATLRHLFRRLGALVTILCSPVAGRSMNHRMRIVLLNSVALCTFITSGCAMFQEQPKKIETVDDYLRLPRVKTTKAADDHALKTSKAAGRLGTS